MKLNEKILYCRKKAGLSQEALAEKLGVSRQAVSKWETAEATPDVGKLAPMARVFGVSIDWLLSDEEPQPESSQAPVNGNSPSWVDSLPGTVGKLIRRYGWLAGVYTSIMGVFFAGIGALARYLSIRMFSLPSTGIYYDSFASDFARSNPVSIMGGVILAFGIVMIASGVILAVVLKRKSRK